MLRVGVVGYQVSLYCNEKEGQQTTYDLTWKRYMKIVAPIDAQSDLLTVLDFQQFPNISLVLSLLVNTTVGSNIYFGNKSLLIATYHSIEA